MAAVVLKATCFLALWLASIGAAVVASPATPQGGDRRVAVPEDTSTRSAEPSIRGSGLNTDLVLQIIEASRVAPPGGVVTLKWVLYSTAGIPGRIRVQLNAPLGWRVVDAEHVHREWLLESWDIVTEEVRVATSPDALVGPNELIRLTAEMIDVPGVAEALTHVQVLSGAGLRAGSAHLSGTTVIGVSQLGPSGFESARAAGAVDLSGQLGKRTNLSLTYRQGPQESLSNYRYYQEEKHFSGSVLHPRWSVQFGNHVFSMGNVIAGPSATGNGVAVRRLNGRVLGEIVLTQPTIFTGEGAGHLWRGSLGIKTGRGTFGFVASEFARPEGGYSTLPPILDPTLDPDSLEELERERELSRGRGSTRALGVGLEGNLQFARTHRLRVRGGTLRLESAHGDKVVAAALEAQYSFSGRRATLNTRVRQTPPSVQGIYLPGNERSADGTLRLVNELRMVGRAYLYENETIGQAFGSGTEGRSLGLRYTRSRWRVEASGNRRDAYSLTASRRRTGLLSFGLPLGPIFLNASTELGEEQIAKGVHAFRAYRGDLRWSGEPGLVSFTMSSYTSGGARPRLRADLLTSLVYGGFELAGGAWAMRGWSGNGAPGAWINIGLPVTSELTLFLGLEHGPQPLAPNSSPWRFSVGLRKKLVIPLPFLQDGTVPPEPGRER